MSNLAGIAELLGVVKAGVDVVGGTVGLFQAVRASERGEAQVDELLLRLALLAVDRNLAILEGVNTRLAKAEQELLFQSAAVLELRPLAALLLNWPSFEDDLDAPASLREADLDNWNALLDQREDHAQLLANARYIVARVGALQALAQLEPTARKDLRLGVRLRNLMTAHRHLRHLLTSEATLAHLIGRRKSSAPVASPA